MIPIYRTDGEWVAVYLEGNLFNVDGEWLGFTVGREVYDSGGLYLGFLSDDKLRLQPPPRPERPKLPANMPLAPMLRSLPHQIIDMFEEYPDRLMYVSETRPDMD